MRASLSRLILPGLLALTPPAASAASLDFGVAYAPGATLLESGLLRLGVSDYSLGAYTLGAGLSSRGLDASVARRLTLTGLGTARLGLDGGVLWDAGLRGRLSASGTLGPVAAGLNLSGWTREPGRFDPLAPLSEAPTRLSASGWQLDATARYRFSREVIADLEAQAGEQPNALLTGALRRGNLTYRLGARAGSGVLGAAAGLSYDDGEGAALSLDGLYGPAVLGLAPSLGLRASADLSGLAGDNSSLHLYAAYEPWRLDVLPLRYGAALSLPLGPGSLELEGRGGLDRLNTARYGARVTYRYVLDAPEEDQDGASPGPDPAADPVPTQP